MERAARRGRRHPVPVAAAARRTRLRALARTASPASSARPGSRSPTPATHAWRWRVDADDLWVGLTSVGNFGVLWRDQTDDVQARLRAAYDALGAPWRDGPDLVFDVECVVVEARVPRS